MRAAVKTVVGKKIPRGQPRAGSSPAPGIFHTSGRIGIKALGRLTLVEYVCMPIGVRVIAEPSRILSRHELSELMPLDSVSMKDCD